MVEELLSYLKDPRRDSFWQKYTNQILEYLQTELTNCYQGEVTLRQLNLIGKILPSYKYLLNFKLKGVLLDRIFNLLRDREITKVPSRSFCEILSSIRGQNLGWRFFIDSIGKLYKAGETDDLFFLKALSVVQGHLRTMHTFDISLNKLLLEQLLLPHYDNPSTVVRKQVVINLAELKLAMEQRMET